MFLKIHILDMVSCLRVILSISMLLLFLIVIILNFKYLTLIEFYNFSLNFQK